MSKETHDHEDDAQVNRTYTLEGNNSILGDDDERWAARGKQ